MPAKQFWKGYLKLSLVTCPVRLTPAVKNSARIAFHTINAKTGHRLLHQYRDSVSQKVVDKEDQTLGYSVGENTFIAIEPEDLKAIAIESTRTIDMTEFVAIKDIDWLWLEKPYYLSPNDKVGEQAFCVIRDGMKRTNSAALGRLVLNRREHSVAVFATDKGMVLWTLAFSEEIRPTDEIFAPVANKKASQDSLSQVVKLIKASKQKFEPKWLDDPVEAKLQKLIAKAQKTLPKAPAPQSPAKPSKGGDNIINIMDTLRKSIENDKKMLKRKAKS